MDDYEYDDEPCPKCGHYPTYARRCHVLGCDDGYIDSYGYDDPLFFNPDETEMCTECWGTGWERWCPKCGCDLQEARLTMRAPDRAKSARKSKPSVSKRSKSGAAGKA